VRTLREGAKSAVGSGITSTTQAKILKRLHHVSVPVRDLEESLRFYRDDLELEWLPSRPSFPFPGEWLALPSGQEVHLVYNPAGTYRDSKKIEPRDIHFAIQVKDWRRATLLLVDKKIESLPDPYLLGLLQTYILDPNDHVIEINALGVPDLQ
jgi:glyoxylase I family protein